MTTWTTSGDTPETRAELVERVRNALIDCALRAHEDAGLRGLCSEGAWEATVSAMRQLDLGALLMPGGNPSPARGTAG
jgi:hypothetical protein